MEWEGPQAIATTRSRSPCCCCCCLRGVLVTADDDIDDDGAVTAPLMEGVESSRDDCFDSGLIGVLVTPPIDEEEDKDDDAEVVPHL